MENKKLVYMIDKDKILMKAVEKYSLLKDFAHDIGITYGRFNCICKTKYESKIRILQQLHKINRVLHFENINDLIIVVEEE